MKKLREYANKNEENILAVLAKPLVVFLLLVIAISCRSIDKHTPLSAELAIAPADTYQLLNERELYFKHKSSLEHIYQKIRNRYSSGELEFFIVFGIYFGSAEGFASEDKYLAVNIKTSKLFHDSKTKFGKRTAEIFSKYIKPLLKIIAEEKEMLDDSLIAGVALGVRWQAKKILPISKYEGKVHEQIQLIVLKDNLNRYLSGELTDQQLLDRSSVFKLDEEKGNQKIAIKLE
jgi:hypothetical protein